jgi:hypothetical protein
MAGERLGAGDDTLRALRLVGGDDGAGPGEALSGAPLCDGGGVTRPLPEIQRDIDRAARRRSELWARRSPTGGDAAALGRLGKELEHLYVELREARSGENQRAGRERRAAEAARHRGAQVPDPA